MPNRRWISSAPSPTTAVPVATVLPASLLPASSLPASLLLGPLLLAALLLAACGLVADDGSAPPSAERAGTTDVSGADQDPTADSGPADPDSPADPGPADPDSPADSGQTDSDSPAGSTPPAGSDPTADPGALSCRPVASTSAGAVERADLVEASGVVASNRHDGVLWAHNDSGGSAGVYGFDLQGNDLGFFALTGPDGPVPALDIEDIAIRDGRIYLADIGDNLRRRPSIEIYVFDEPAPGTDGSVPLLSVITARYPDGPTDAEALLVDPLSGELLILSKNLDDGQAPTGLYSLDPTTVDAGTTDNTAVEPVEMERVGSLDVAELTARSSVFSINAILFPGSATGADVSADGGLIAIRTYGTVWLFGRGPGQTLAQALASEPCEGRAEAEAQGESVGFLPDRGDGLVRYATVSEGGMPAVNVVTVEVRSE